MNENNLVIGEPVEDVLPYDSEPVTIYSVDGSDGGESGVPSVSGGDALGGVYWATTSVDAVPVMVMAANQSYVGSGGQSYQLPTYYVDYFKGVLNNMQDTEYVAFCSRESTGGYNSYIEHYYLIYDIEVDGDAAIVGEYPCIDIYRNSGNYDYTVEYGTYSLSLIPDFSYGSFGLYSDIRQGVTKSETWAFLFFLGFFTVYFVCTGFYNHIIKHIYRK